MRFLPHAFRTSHGVGGGKVKDKVSGNPCLKNSRLRRSRCLREGVCGPGGKSLWCESLVVNFPRGTWQARKDSLPLSLLPRPCPVNTNMTQCCRWVCKFKVPQLINYQDHILIFSRREMDMQVGAGAVLFSKASLGCRDALHAGT